MEIYILPSMFYENIPAHKRLTNPLRLRQKVIFFYENLYFWFKFVPKVPINNMPVLV